MEVLALETRAEPVRAISEPFAGLQLHARHGERSTCASSPRHRGRIAARPRTGARPPSRSSVLLFARPFPSAELAALLTTQSSGASAVTGAASPDRTPGRLAAVRAVTDTVRPG